jgi:hypothetical protein
MIPALGKLSQEFTARLDYIGRPCLKKSKENKIKQTKDPV